MTIEIDNKTKSIIPIALTENEIYLKFLIKIPYSADSSKGSLTTENDEYADGQSANSNYGYWQGVNESDSIRISGRNNSKDIISWYMTENGSLYIVDRVKKMIIRYDGFKVFPSLIEKTVLSHDAVVSCCAVGARDEEHVQGKLPIVFAVLKPECSDNHAQFEQELFALCKNELPEYAQPVGFRFIDALPLTPIGKIDYRALEKLAGQK